MSDNQRRNQRGLVHGQLVLLDSVVTTNAFQFSEPYDMADLGHKQATIYVEETGESNGATWKLQSRAYGGDWHDHAPDPSSPELTLAAGVSSFETLSDHVGQFRIAYKSTSAGNAAAFKATVVSGD